jgi:hypothetical protein
MNLVEQAIKRMPSAVQADALQVCYLSAAGWQTTAIGREVGITRSQVITLRKRTAGEVIVYLREQGYTPVETIRTLGVPTAVVHEALAA